MNRESIVLEADPRSVLAAIKQANQAVEGCEKQTVGSGDKMQKSIERMSEILLKMNDRSRSSMERLTPSIEKQAAAYGKTGRGADRRRPRPAHQKLGDEQGMFDRITVSRKQAAAGQIASPSLEPLLKVKVQPELAVLLAQRYRRPVPAQRPLHAHYLRVGLRHVGDVSERDVARYLLLQREARLRIVFHAADGRVDAQVAHAEKTRCRSADCRYVKVPGRRALSISRPARR
jgi:hypothetical protein